MFLPRKTAEDQTEDRKAAEPQLQHRCGVPTLRYWFRAEDAEERRGSKNLNPTLRYSATSAREILVALHEIGCQQCKDRV